MKNIKIFNFFCVLAIIFSCSDIKKSSSNESATFCLRVIYDANDLPSDAPSTVYKIVVDSVLSEEANASILVSGKSKNCNPYGFCLYETVGDSTYITMANNRPFHHIRDFFILEKDFLSSGDIKLKIWNGLDSVLLELKGKPKYMINESQILDFKKISGINGEVPIIK